MKWNNYEELNLKKSFSFIKLYLKRIKIKKITSKKTAPKYLKLIFTL
jgi:hypothetical protein